MKKYLVWVEVGYADERREEIIEIDENATDEYIDELCRDVAFNEIDWGYEEVDVADVVEVAE